MSKGSMMYDKTGKKTLTRKITAYSGIDGKSDAPIVLTSENGRAVLDFKNPIKERPQGLNLKATIGLSAE